MISHSRPWIIDSDVIAVVETLKNGNIADYSITSKFEEELLSVVGGVDAVTTQSGSAAAELCLRSINVGPSDEVILPTYVCKEVREAVLNVGAIPVYCDSGATWNADRDSILSVKSSRTKAVILVNIYGILNDSIDLGIPIIEDHCQSVGLKRVNAVAGFFSFHATKCLTTGTGGAAVFNDKELSAKVRKKSKPISGLAASLGISQLQRYQQFLSRRAEIASQYFTEMPKELTANLRSLNSMYFRFPLSTRLDFNHVQSEFLRQGVVVKQGVDDLLHRAAGLDDGRFPNAVSHFNQTVSIPIYPSMSESDIETVIQAVCRTL